jgi:hypothetical protein
VDDNIKDKLFMITPPTGSAKQDSGATDVMVVDLLRLTRTLKIQGNLLTSQDKGNLLNIIDGAGIKGGVITLTYPDGGNKSTFQGYIEDFTCTQKSQDFGQYWVSGKDYTIGSIVEYLGTFYSAKASLTNSTSNPATDTTNWSELTTNDFAKFDVSISFVEGIKIG